MKDDVEKYIERRKRADKGFADGFEAGYGEFKIGLLLRQAREEAGVTRDYLGDGVSQAEVLEDSPDLTAEDIQACLSFAAMPRSLHHATVIC